MKTTTIIHFATAKTALQRQQGINLKNIPAGSPLTPNQLWELLDHNIKLGITSRS